MEQKIEGKEITPNLNRWLRATTTLYAPKVLTQVKGGRSIDCQLIVNAGLLPIESGCYSFEFPNNTYPTLTKAMAEQWQAKSILFTVDKPIIWNQGIIAGSFGFQQIFSHDSWDACGSRGTGPRKNVGDEMFFQQAIEKIEADGLWSDNAPVFMQFVTYSGHSPFKLPAELHKLHLRNSYPEKLRDYIITANYTDHALSILVNYLKSRIDYAETMVVIMGDYEGLAADREALCHSQQGKDLVSNKQFTPLIVLNSPVGLKYDNVMGQIDIYPTLLQLMHLDHYDWKGLGQSILDSQKYPIAIAPDLHAEGNTAEVSTSEKQWLMKSYEISDKLIHYNYFLSPHI